MLQRELSRLDDRSWIVSLNSKDYQIGRQILNDQVWMQDAIHETGTGLRDNRHASGCEAVFRQIMSTC